MRDSRQLTLSVLWVYRGKSVIVCIKCTYCDSPKWDLWMRYTEEMWHSQDGSVTLFILNILWECCLISWTISVWCILLFSLLSVFATFLWDLWQFLLIAFWQAQANAVTVSVVLWQSQARPFLSLLSVLWLSPQWSKMVSIGCNATILRSCIRSSNCTNHDLWLSLFSALWLSQGILGALFL
jgi:hypothetical protein